MMCLLQSKLSRYSFKTFAPRGLWEPSTNNLLLLAKSFNFPSVISWSLAILLILVIPDFICISLISISFIFLRVAIADEIFSNWNCPFIFGNGSFNPPISSS